MKVLEFKQNQLAQKYKLTNDNHIVFSPHKMEWKSKDFSLSGLKVSKRDGLSQVIRPGKVDFIEMKGNSLFDQSRNRFKRMKNDQRFSEDQNSGPSDC